MPFETVVHQVATNDAQPSSESGGILVLVTGALLVCLTHLALNTPFIDGDIDSSIPTGGQGTEANELHSSFPTTA